MTGVNRAIVVCGLAGCLVIGLCLTSGCGGGAGYEGPERAAVQGKVTFDGSRHCHDVYGCENAPYVWLKTKDGMGSWEFFDLLLEKANVVGTPGAGFGASGEGYFRLSAFNNLNNVKEAMDRISKI